MTNFKAQKDNFSTLKTSFWKKGSFYLFFDFRKSSTTEYLKNAIKLHSPRDLSDMSRSKQDQFSKIRCSKLQNVKSRSSYWRPDIYKHACIHEYKILFILTQADAHAYMPRLERRVLMVYVIPSAAPLVSLSLTAAISFPPTPTEVR